MLGENRKEISLPFLVAEHKALRSEISYEHSSGCIRGVPAVRR